MNASSDEDTQFNCRLCSFVGTSKTEIAEHFLTDHIEQYVSLSKASKADTETAKETEVTETPSKKSKSRGKAERHGKAANDEESSEEQKKSKTLDEIMEQKLESDTSPGFGRGLRRRKTETPVKYTMDDDDDEEEWLPKKDHEPTKKIHVKAPSMIAKGRGRPRKRGRRPRQPVFTLKKKVTKDANKSPPSPPTPPPKSKKKEEVRKKVEERNLPIPNYVFNRIIDEQVGMWFQDYKQSRETMEMVRCPNDRCANMMSKEEMEVHEKCHVPQLDGFRCCACGYISLHWAKMRVHYRTEHDTKLNAAMCNFEGCSKVFPCIGTKLLQTHAIKAHIKPKLLEKLKSPDFDITEYEQYMIEPENDADRLSMAKKRGRPRRQEIEEYEDEEAEGDEGTGLPKRKKFQRYKVYVCTVCLARFKDELEMSEHKEEHYKKYSGESTDVIYCTECSEFTATDEEAMREHLSNKHKRMLHLHRCHECKNFSTNHYHDLKKHLVTHTGAKNYMCELCGRRTTTPFNLRIHYRRIHATEEEKKYDCVNCDYKCADKGILKEHIKHKHGLLLNRDSYGRPKPTPTFACNICDYVGRKQKSLDYHMRIHTENRQFKCQLCPYASKTKNNLVLHVRTHEGMQPNKCPHCDFRGATNKIVSEHIMSKHAKVRPYRCNVCGWTAAYNGNMWKHIENHQKVLGDQMPEFPVSVMSGGVDTLNMPTALRAPSGKRRGQGKSDGDPSSPTSKPKVKRSRTKYSEPPSGVILANRSAVQEVSVTVQEVPMAVQVARSMAQDVQPQAPPPQPQPHPLPQSIINTEGMVIQMINVEPSHDVQPVVKVSSDGTHIRHHPIMEYSVPPVSVTQQIIAAGSDMAQVISEQQHYQHHHLHQQQQQLQQQHQQQQPQQQQPQPLPQHIIAHPPPAHTPHSTVLTTALPTSLTTALPTSLTTALPNALPHAQQAKAPVHPIPLEIHAVTMHPSTQSNVPTPVVEHIVRDPDHAVHHLVAAMMPRW